MHLFKGDKKTKKANIQRDRNSDAAVEQERVGNLNCNKIQQISTIVSDFYNLSVNFKVTIQVDIFRAPK